MDININSMTGIPNNYLNILDANPKVIFVVGAIIIIYFVIKRGHFEINPQSLSRTPT